MTKHKSPKKPNYSKSRAMSSGRTGLKYLTCPNGHRFPSPIQGSGFVSFGNTTNCPKCGAKVVF